MTNLTITDLAITAELDRKAMSAVRGGYLKGGASYLPLFDSAKHNFSFTATQLTSQEQNNVNETGNNVASVSGIHSTFKPSQSSTTSISF
ncbi:MAG: hypothetical protein H7234_06740 [Herminiimonas sp.]|nr:hypothetical protein [Herminiimonas sp.]